MANNFIRVSITFVLFITLIVQPIQPANILGYLVEQGQSHFHVSNSLLKGLAENGHNVTVIGLFSQKNQYLPPNYHYIHLKMNKEEESNLNDARNSLFAEADKTESSGFSIAKIKEQFNIFSSFLRIMANYLHHPDVEKLKRDGQFDFVVFGYFFNDFQVGIAAHFNCPAAILTATPPMKVLRDYVGNPSGVAYTSIFTSNEHMSFMGRVQNYLITTAELIAINGLNKFVFEPYYLENFPSTKGYPTFNDAKKHVSLVFVSSHFSQTNPIAALPNLIEVSGIQIKKKPNPLPDDIRNWLDDAKDGAIFVSFGSNINSAQMTETKRKIFLSVFGKLKQRILWKWEDDKLPDKPNNVMIGKWLPQDDILAHPNVKLFISHCGKGSVNEAKYHGVPILGIPMFGDQPTNLEIIVADGWAIPLDFSTLNEKDLTEGLNEILTNTTYRSVVKNAADLYKDRPEHPLDTAIWWVEYAIRHKGAKHMQSQAKDLNFFQYHSLDVTGFLLLICYVCWKVIVFCSKFIWKKLFGRNKSKKIKKQ